MRSSNGQRGLVCQYDVVCFDEISGVSFDQKDGVKIMKGYMESGEFSRGKENIRADGSIVMVGNFDVDVAHQAVECTVRLALECRRRVKEQQKRIGSAEFRNTHFSYTLGQDGVEKFVVTPELQSEDTARSYLHSPTGVSP
jgi:predicted ATP-dependent Lon-type protease